VQFSIDNGFTYEERDYYDDYHLEKLNPSLSDKSAVYLTSDFDVGQVNFLRVHKLIYKLDSLSINSNSEINFFTHIFHMSPNLKHLKLLAYDSSSIINLLRLIPTKNITKLYCKATEIHHSFLIDLAQIIPQIQELTLLYIYFYEYSIKPYEERKRRTKFLTAKVAVDQVEIYFKELIHAYLYLLPFYDEDTEIDEAHKQLKIWLNQGEQKTKFYSSYELHPRHKYDQGWLDDPFDDGSSIVADYCLYVSPERKDEIVTKRKMLNSDLRSSDDEM